MTNPFHYGNPIQPAHFVGRRKELRRVRNRIAGQAGQSTAVVGEPRSGKSSLLAYLADRGVRARLYGEAGKRLLFCEMDIQGLPHGFGQADFWEMALAPIKERVVAGYPNSAVAGAYRTCEQNAFGAAVLERLTGELQRANLRLVLLLDEFDGLMFHPVLHSTEFFGGLRSVASRSPGGSLVLVVASRVSLPQLDRRTQQFQWTGSPYFNFLIQVPLGPLAEKDAEQLLAQGGGRFTPEDRRFIAGFAGGHPYLLQAAASALWEVYEDNEDEDAQRRRELAGAHVLDDVASTLGATWRSWSAETRLAVATVTLAQMPDLIPHRQFHTSLLVKELADFAPELRAMGRRGFLVEDKTQPAGWRVRPTSMLWWLAEELTRTTREEKSFDEWICAQEWDGLLTKGEKKRMRQMVHAIGGAVKSALPDIVKVLVKRVAG